ncbi:hypothetical protein IG631_00154 [Alternaria alternata]|nr:hypothetical protein IG631_00154 [Alternaria alternata]
MSAIHHYGNALCLMCILAEASCQRSKPGAPRTYGAPGMQEIELVMAYWSSSRRLFFICHTGLATGAQDPEIRKLAVEMLNECHVEVRAAQEDSANQELLRLLKRERQAQEKQREEQHELRSGAKVVPEKGLYVGLKNIVDSKFKRLRKSPERFSDIKWTDSGKRWHSPPGRIRSRRRFRRE